MQILLNATPVKTLGAWVPAHHSAEEVASFERKSAIIEQRVQTILKQMVDNGVCVYYDKEKETK